MNITLVQVMTVNGLLQKIKDQKISIKTSFKFAQLGNEIDSKVKFFEEKMRNIVDKYAEKDNSGELQKTEDGNGIKIKPENGEICQKEILELSTLDVELSDKYTFELEELETLEMSIEDLKTLMPFIKDKE